MKILFLNTCNNHFYENPLITLVEFEKEPSDKIIRDNNFKQLGVLRSGTRVFELLDDLSKEGYTNKVITQEGRYNDYKTKGYREYKVLAGNY